MLTVFRLNNDETLLLPLQNGFEPFGPLKDFAVRQDAGGIDRGFAVQRPPRADGVVIFEAEAQRSIR